MQFGEYLVQNRILSAHQILKALAEQRRRRTFIPLLLVDLGGLADYRALHYYNVAEKNSEDFLEVLLREGFISEEQCVQIRTAWMRSGPPLGKLLVELGFMNEESRAAVLEEYEVLKSLDEHLAKNY